MITKTFDCIKMKNELQNKLYENINPKNTIDYINKLKVSINNSQWINEFKQKRQLHTTQIWSCANKVCLAFSTFPLACFLKNFIDKNYDILQFETKQMCLKNKNTVTKHANSAKGRTGNVFKSDVRWKSTFNILYSKMFIN